MLGREEVCAREGEEVGDGEEGVWCWEGRRFVLRREEVRAGEGGGLCWGGRGGWWWGGMRVVLGREVCAGE